MVVFLLCHTCIFAQTPFRAYPTDNFLYAPFGKLAGTNDSFVGPLFITFEDYELHVNHTKADSLLVIVNDMSSNDFGRCFTAICDTFGQPLCWFLGDNMLNRNGFERIPYPPAFYFPGTDWGGGLGWCCTGGAARLGQSLLLPYPGNDQHKAIFLYNKLPPETLDSAPPQAYTIWGDTSTILYKSISLNYMVIDLDGNNGKGEFELGETLIVADTLLNLASWPGVRHANGRDWWFWYPKFNSSEYHKILVDPTGPHYMGVFDADSVFYIDKRMNFQKVSADGNKLYTCSSTRARNLINVYDIDRCTGNLSPFKSYIRPLSWQPTLPIFPPTIIRDIEPSPDGRYLYVIDAWNPNGYDTIVFEADTIISYNLDTLFYQRVLQLDTWSAESWDPELTLVGVDSLFPNLYAEQVGTWFIRGGDYKLYIANGGQTQTDSPISPEYGDYWVMDEGWGVINHPNRPGPAASYTFEPRINFERGYYRPNYQLGPLDGSPCDTLGLDSYPKAIYRFDFADENTVNFEDYSILNPETWSWDFGDGFGSEDQNTQHYYPNDGVYQCCLTVSNSFGSDTYCRLVHIGIATGVNEALAKEATVYPNPFDNFITVDLPEGLPQGVVLQMYNPLGQFVGSWNLNQSGKTGISLPNLQAGVYSYELRLGKTLVKGGTLVKKE